jgi:arsenite-transporting ATPase
VFDAAEDLLNRLANLHSILIDKAASTVRLVVNPEKMVIAEAQRSFTYLNLYGYVTDAVICNRVLPQEVTGGYFDTWKTSQQGHRRRIEEAFSPLPVLTAPLLEKEAVGLASLRSMAPVRRNDERVRGRRRRCAEERRTCSCNAVVSRRKCR